MSYDIINTISNDYIHHKVKGQATVNSAKNHKENLMHIIVKIPASSKDNTPNLQKSEGDQVTTMLLNIKS
jgi:hypothetical protein